MLPTDIGRVEFEDGHGNFLREEGIEDAFGKRGMGFFQEMGT